MSLAPPSHTSKFEYYLVNAFSDKPFGGNPAVVAFLNPKETSTEILVEVAATFRQPMTVFLSKQTPSATDTVTEKYAVRYFTAEHEAHLCIHATVAAAKIIFQMQGLKEGDLIEFVTQSDEVLTARMVMGEKGEEWTEIELTKAQIVQVQGEEEKIISDIIQDCFGKQLSIHHIAKGIEPYHHYLLVEVDESDDIKNCNVRGLELGERTGFGINAITAKSSTGNEHFTSRVFVPYVSLGGEDHVCGSAHSLLGPYWAKKQRIPDGEQIKAAQVSHRGGDLRLFSVKEESKLKMRGQAVVISTGVFFF
ncbi:hypothetical protein D9757_002318 [Collybiopsis confluens]|uniref:Diaminopimelate epimerase-like protein n=1 Tax=Collybiopsis confluens TaxID=2823264 RepID=A0A8H5HZT5_9AGAR|nr:hypothetical protein D9757_002318 [Collybiopsis confluens]